MFLIMQHFIAFFWYRRAVPATGTALDCSCKQLGLFV